jgi:FAD-dependent urate hydroxylase
MKLAKDDPILIIGASESGLMIALALHYYGYTQVRIFDQQTELSWPQVPVQLGTQLLSSLSEFELVAAIEKIGLYWEHGDIRLKSNRVFHHLNLDRLKVSTGLTPMTVSTPALGQLLQDRLPEEWFDLGREFISYTNHPKEAEVHFANGETIAGALVIAADGFDSRVRLQMIGETERRGTDLYTWRTLISPEQLATPEAITLPPPYNEYLGRGCRATYYPLRDGSVGLELTTYRPKEALSGEKLRYHLQSTYEEFPRPIPALLERVNVADLVGEPHFYRDQVKHIHQGRVILIGRAAHPTLPYLGMANNLGLTDALLLARLIEENSMRLQRAFTLFEKKRRRQIKRFQQAGKRYDRTVSVRHKFSYAWRNLIYGFLSVKRTIGPFYRINLSDDYKGK